MTFSSKGLTSRHDKQQKNADVADLDTGQQAGER